MIPIPEAQQKALNSSQSNASLYFYRMNKWKAGTKGKVFDRDTEDMTALQDALSRRMVNTADVHEHQQKIIDWKADHAFEFYVKLTSPLIIGLGLSHPTETGFSLSRNLGVPFIPASSIKGVLRLATAVYIAQTYPDRVQINDKGEAIIPDKEALLRVGFGDVDSGGKDAQRGQVVFLDAYPVGTPQIELDILTPHFTSYYQNQGKKPPTETDNPIPVSLLRLAEGTHFVFRVFGSGLPEQDAELSKFFEALPQIFNIAFQDIGFGSKTALGYGRFIEDAATKAQAAADRENRIRKKREEAEAAAEAAKIAQMSPLEQIQYQVAKVNTIKEQELENWILNKNMETNPLREWPSFDSLPEAKGQWIQDAFGDFVKTWRRRHNRGKERAEKLLTAINAFESSAPAQPAEPQKPKAATGATGTFGDERIPEYHFEKLTKGKANKQQKAANALMKLIDPGNGAKAYLRSDIERALAVLEPFGFSKYNTVRAAWGLDG